VLKRSRWRVLAPSNPIFRHEPTREPLIRIRVARRGSAAEDGPKMLLHPTFGWLRLHVSGDMLAAVNCGLDRLAQLREGAPDFRKGTAMNGRWYAAMVLAILKGWLRFVRGLPSRGSVPPALQPGIRQVTPNGYLL
jgi:hypothetical protein